MKVEEDGKDWEVVRNKKKENFRGAGSAVGGDAIERRNDGTIALQARRREQRKAVQNNLRAIEDVSAMPFLPDDFPKLPVASVPHHKYDTVTLTLPVLKRMLSFNLFGVPHYC